MYDCDLATHKCAKLNCIGYRKEKKDQVENKICNEPIVIVVDEADGNMLKIEKKDRSLPLESGSSSEYESDSDDDNDAWSCSCLDCLRASRRVKEAQFKHGGVLIDSDFEYGEIDETYGAAYRCECPECSDLLECIGVEKGVSFKHGHARFTDHHDRIVERRRKEWNVESQPGLCTDFEVCEHCADCGEYVDMKIFIKAGNRGNLTKFNDHIKNAVRLAALEFHPDEHSHLRFMTSLANRISDRYGSSFAFVPTCVDFSDSIQRVNYLEHDRLLVSERRAYSTNYVNKIPNEAKPPPFEDSFLESDSGLFSLFVCLAPHKRKDESTEYFAFQCDVIPLKITEPVKYFLSLSQEKKMTFEVTDEEFHAFGGEFEKAMNDAEDSRKKYNA